jgi:hypothetical protein
MRTMVLTILLFGCATEWKVQGGPGECVQMCKSWGMELTGMVGVATQARFGGGSSACVCEVPRSAGGAANSSAPTAGALVMLQRHQEATRSTRAGQ